MSFHEYQASKDPRLTGASFYALIMAAMRRADTTNAAKLQAAFPETWAELHQRYNAPGGRLEHDDLDGCPVCGRITTHIIGCPEADQPR